MWIFSAHATSCLLKLRPFVRTVEYLIQKSADVNAQALWHDQQTNVWLFFCCGMSQQEKEDGKSLESEVFTKASKKGLVSWSYKKIMIDLQNDLT